ncbi:MAG: LPS export ABC transporter periplasmic protein LptC [Acetobacter sp.]|nr:LPS export ABC transporter periplasmic protein LptC [Acetobacter sp.]
MNNDEKQGNAPRRKDFGRSAEQIRQQRETLDSTPTRSRPVVSSESLARRRILLRRAKWILPAVAMMLLGSIAVWPEIDRIISHHKTALTEVTKLHLESGNLSDAVYRSVDTHDRPYMVTSKEAHQINEDRIDLTAPIADSIMQGGNWNHLSAKSGVYMQRSQILNLKNDVSLYRDDGIMMLTPVADVSLKDGVVASDSWIRAEGPFGVLDAKGYWISQHDGIAQFRGPGRLILNDDRSAPAHPDRRTANTQTGDRTH